MFSMEVMRIVDNNKMEWSNCSWLEATKASLQLKEHMDSVCWMEISFLRRRFAGRRKGYKF